MGNSALGQHMPEALPLLWKRKGLELAGSGRAGLRGTSGVYAQGANGGICPEFCVGILSMLRMLSGVVTPG